jgi:hypothetical protein
MFKRARNKAPLDFSTVIVFSMLDDPFIDACIDGVLPASNKVLLIAYDRLLGGQDQTDILTDIIRRNAHKGIETKILPLVLEMAQVFPINPEIKTNQRIFMNFIRKVGFDLVKDSAAFTLFLDGDEVAEPQRLLDWKNSYRTNASSLSLANYYYFREPIYRAEKLEHSPVMVNAEKLEALFRKDPMRFINLPHERKDYRIEPSEKIEEVLIHHFSWVRTKDQMMAKVKNWCHSGQRDWQKLVETEFSRDFNGTDFVHGYKYKEVPNLFNIKLQ